MRFPRDVQIGFEGGISVTGLGGGEVVQDASGGWAGVSMSRGGAVGRQDNHFLLRIFK